MSLLASLLLFQFFQACLQALILGCLLTAVRAVQIFKVRNSVW